MILGMLSRLLLVLDDKDGLFSEVAEVAEEVVGLADAAAAVGEAIDSLSAVSLVVVVAAAVGVSAIWSASANNS